MIQAKETEQNQPDLGFSVGSERNILSICLKDQDRLIDVESEEIQSFHFYVPGHRYIFMAMQYLYQKKITATPLAIMEVLSNEEAKKSIDELGGLDYLNILTETNLPSDSLSIFIEKVKQSYTRRSLYNISMNVQSFVLSDKAEVLNPAELVGNVETQINDLQLNTSVSQKVYKMGTDTERVLKERAETPGEIPGLEVGWSEYDRLTNGAQEGDLVIVCAESKTGKSVTLTNWAKKICIDDRLPGLYIDTEMNEREQEDRLLANLTGIPQYEIVSGSYVLDTQNGTAVEKLAKLKSARELLGLGEYYHIYMPHFTIEKVTALARKFQIQVGIKALFFDYIKIPSDNANFKTMQEYQALGFFTSGLKDLAGVLRIPVFSACQANRSDLGNGKRKDAGSIGGSYRILQLASKLIFLTNKTEEQIAKEGVQNGNQQLWIEYQRNGASNCEPINLFFDRDILRQSEVS